MPYREKSARAGLPRRLIAVCAPVFALFVAIQPVLAQDAGQDVGDEQEQLHAQMLRHPTNYVVTFAYVKVATDRGDYEAGKSQSATEAVLNAGAYSPVTPGSGAGIGLILLLPLLPFLFPVAGVMGAAHRIHFVCVRRCAA